MKVLLASAVVVLLALAFVGALVFWARWSRGRDANAVQVVAKNSGFLLLSQFTVKGLDFLTALFVLRALGPTGNGQYGYAVLVWLYIKTITDFGLGTLATQQIAQEKGRAGVLLGQTMLLRLVLLALSLLPLVLFLGLNLGVGGIGAVEIGAIALLILSIVPTTYAEAAESVFRGYERFEIPAGIVILGSVVGLALRLGTLALGWGPVGLAFAALVANCVTLVPLILLIRWLGVRAEWSLPWGATRDLLRDGWPLLVNGLLASLFFRVDTFLLRPMKGADAVGLYDVGYKLINTLLVITSTLTLVLFPRLAAQAGSDRAAVTRTYHFAVRVLLIIALPLTVGGAVLATELVRIIGGAAFLPGAATALRLTIWLLPLSAVNGLTQYVLIALGQQRRITGAFIATVLFNVVANALFIPAFSFRASAVISVLSEVVLFVPFVFWVRRFLGPLPLLRLAWQPLIAAALFAFVAWGVGWRMGAGAWVGAILGGAVYCVALLALGTVGAQERALVRRLVQRVESGGT
jgi:O-antigen/teichoic acid export membrane protein